MVIENIVTLHLFAINFRTGVVVGLAELSRGFPGVDAGQRC